MILAWSKSLLRGYSTPTSNDASTASSAAYVKQQFAWWNKTLGDETWHGRRVLELCPGDSLGIGVLALRAGAASYTAVDAFRLEKPENTAAILGQELRPELVYIVDRQFDMASMLEGRRFDLIISNAAFEHFDDPAQTIRGLSPIAAPGCIAALIIDFQTHSRWIRDRDPNNIYRFSDWVYRLFFFPGQPNRWRPGDVIQTLSSCGWENVRMVHVTKVDGSSHHLEGLNHRFSGRTDMAILNCVMVAERPY